MQIGPESEKLRGRFLFGQLDNLWQLKFFQKYLLTAVLAIYYNATMKNTNRQLAETFGLSLNHFKRQAVLALGRDPEADQAGGVRRIYSLDDAFIIYLFGKVLVKDCRMGLTEAKIHIENLKSILKAENLLPSKINKAWNVIPDELRKKADDFVNSNAGKVEPPFMPGLRITILPGNSYILEKYLQVYYIGSEESIIFAVDKCFPESKQRPDWSVPGPHYQLMLFEHLVVFMALLES